MSLQRLVSPWLRSSQVQLSNRRAQAADQDVGNQPDKRKIACRHCRLQPQRFAKVDWIQILGKFFTWSNFIKLIITWSSFIKVVEPRWTPQIGGHCFTFSQPGQPPCPPSRWQARGGLLRLSLEEIGHRFGEDGNELSAGNNSAIRVISVRYMICMCNV